MLRSTCCGTPALRYPGVRPPGIRDQPYLSAPRSTLYLHLALLGFILHIYAIPTESDLNYKTDTTPSSLVRILTHHACYRDDCSALRTLSLGFLRPRGHTGSGTSFKARDRNRTSLIPNPVLLTMQSSLTSPHTTSTM